jgi:acyl carrier protein
VISAHVLRVLKKKLGQEGLSDAELLNIEYLDKALVLDSVDKVELLVALEEEFAVTISDAEAAEWTKAQQYIDYVKEHI